MGPTFTITRILRMHTGHYACLAQNSYLNTRSKKTITLTVYCKSLLQYFSFLLVMSASPSSFLSFFS